MAMAKRWEYKKRNRITNYGTIRANAIKTKIDKSQAESKCRLCGRDSETQCVNVLCWHNGSIKGGITGCRERYIRKYVENLNLI